MSFFCLIKVPVWDKRCHMNTVTQSETLALSAVAAAATIGASAVAVESVTMPEVAPYELHLIPLSRLRPSRRNVRQSGGTAIPELAASIARVGLLQNLTVITSPDGQWFEVVAGRRRLAALKLLVTRRLAELWRFGHKSGRGHYRYQGREALPDPDLARVCAEEARALGIAQQPDVGDDTIVRRCVAPLVDEGRRLLAEGMACRASDIDLVWVLGYGFPAHRGGPMVMAGEALGG